MDLPELTEDEARLIEDLGEHDMETDGEIDRRKYIKRLEKEIERLREENTLLKNEAEEDASQMATLEDDVRYWREKSEQLDEELGNFR